MKYPHAFPERVYNVTAFERALGIVRAIGVRFPTATFSKRKESVHSDDDDAWSGWAGVRRSVHVS